MPDNDNNQNYPSDERELMAGVASFVSELISQTRSANPDGIYTFTQQAMDGIGHLFDLTSFNAIEHLKVKDSNEQ